MKNEWRVLVGVCAVVVAVYAYMAQSGGMELLTRIAADSYYNLLVQGFRAGQLSLKKEVPLGLAQLADPYDPTANAPYRALPYGVHDVSYYRGRLYLYFGVTPALILFWPYVALTHDYLFHRQAVTIFCAIGFLAGAAVLRALWRRYFSEVGVSVVAACAVALGFSTGMPVLLSRSDVWEVPISCGYMLTMLALGAVWCALHEGEQRCRWLAAASLAYGLAVGARPTLLFGALILLVPVVQAWRERRRVWKLLIAAIGPIAVIGLGLMLYNELRFGSAYEFGQHYELDAVRPVPRLFFRPHFLWFNLRVYFLEPARWSARFPFVQEIAVPPLPSGYELVETPFGVLTNIPLVWLALAVPLAWRNRSRPEASIVRWFMTAVALLFGTCVLPLLFFWSAIIRYEVDFLPALVLLAVVGILGLERVLADRAAWRYAARCGWGLLLVFSLAFNLLANVKRYAETHLLLGTELSHAGNFSEAIGQYDQALRLDPDYADAHNNLGIALARTGNIEPAIAHYERALQIKPNYAEAHLNLGIALARTGNIEPAIAHYERALQIKPNYAEAHNNLGNAFLREGKVSEAIAHYEQAVRLMPDYMETHFNLGLALEKLGRTPEAIEHYQQALKLRPNFTPAKNALERLQAGQ